ncbi:hypothetical protein Dimus_027324 [Dionaea muscipula]
MGTSTTAIVDTSSPFSSVKEAVALFGHRLVPRDIRPNIANGDISRNHIEHQSHEDDQYISYHDDNYETILRKLVDELEKTKMEIKLLKERESETEVALASLNSLVHLNMSRMAQVEAAEAAKAAVAMGSNHEESRWYSSPKITLGEVLRVGERSEELGKLLMMKKKKNKKKPIVPLVSDIFGRKKRSPSHGDVSSPFYSSPCMFFT